MKKILSLFLLSGMLVGCGKSIGSEETSSEKVSNVSSETSSKDNEYSSLSYDLSTGARAAITIDDEDQTAHKLNDTVEIKDKEGNTVYEITFTEIKDVTEEEIANYGGYESTWINHYSNGVGKQAVRVTWRIKNIADDNPLISFPIGLKVTDESGEISPGGWINKNSSIYGIDGEGFLEEDQDVFLGDTKSGAGYYILTNPSSDIKVQFTSERYHATTNFEFSVQ